MEDRHKGILIVLFGVFCISPDAVLVRFLSEDEKADPWVISFWKLVFSMPITAIYALYENSGSLRKMWRGAVQGRWYYLFSVPIQVGISYCFTFAFAYTSAAKALLVINMNPLWCAVLGRLFLGDILPWRTIIALILSLGCMLLIFIPEIVEQDDDNHNEPEGAVSTSGGNLIALLTGVLLAVNISIMRKASQKEVNLIGTTPLAGLFGCLAVLGIRDGEVMPESIEWPQPWQFWLAVLADGLAVGVVYASLTVGPRLANGAEIALVVLLEVILGSLWVFVAYGEVPPKWTLIGGSILLLILALHESAPLFQRARASFTGKGQREKTMELEQSLEHSKHESNAEKESEKHDKAESQELTA